jgi:hypothetical protein
VDHGKSPFSCAVRKTHLKKKNIRKGKKTLFLLLKSSL